MGCSLILMSNRKGLYGQRRLRLIYTVKSWSMFDAGIQYMRELRHPTNEVPPFFECTLCHMVRGKTLLCQFNVIKHICTRGHRLNYFVRIIIIIFIKPKHERPLDISKFIIDSLKDKLKLNLFQCRMILIQERCTSIYKANGLLGLIG